MRWRLWTVGATLSSMRSVDDQFECSCVGGGGFAGVVSTDSTGGEVGARAFCGEFPRAALFCVL